MMNSKSRGIHQKKSVFLILRIILFMLFVAVNIILAAHHESWRDEAQCWVLARNLSLSDLIGILPSEGHPVLWFLVLRLLIAIGLPFRYLPYFTTVLISIALAFVLFKFDLPIPVQICISVSALFFYQNAVVARVYALIVLLSVLITYCWGKKYENPIIFGILTALLLQTHVIMAGMGCALLFLMVLQYIYSKGRDKRLFAGTLIALVSFILLPIELYQRADDTIVIDSSLSSLLDSVILIPLRNILNAFSANSISAFFTSISLERRFCILMLLTILCIVSLIGLLSKEHRGLFSIIFVCLCSFTCGFFIREYIYKGVEQMQLTWLLSTLLFGGYNLYRLCDRKYNNIIAICMAILFLLTAPKMFRAGKSDYYNKYSDSKGVADYLNETASKNSVILTLNSISFPPAYAYLVEMRPDITFINVSTGEEYDVHRWGIPDRSDITEKEWKNMINSIPNNFSM